MKKVCKSQAWGEWFTNFSSILPKSQLCVSTSHGYFDEKVSLHLSSVGLSYGLIIRAGRDGLCIAYSSLAMVLHLC